MGDLQEGFPVEVDQGGLPQAAGAGLVVVEVAVMKSSSMESALLVRIIKLVGS